MLQENQSSFKLQSCAVGLKIFQLSLFIDPKILFHNLISIQSNWTNRIGIQHKHPRSVIQLGMEIEDCGNPPKISQSVVLYERVLHENLWYCVTVMGFKPHSGQRENMFCAFVEKIYLKLYFGFLLLQSTHVAHFHWFCKILIKKDNKMQNQNQQTNKQHERIYSTLVLLLVCLTAK